jgi:Flp pilus assembly pilin Flp
MPLVSALISILRSREAGQGLTEYALILTLIAVVAILALVFLGSNLDVALSNIGNSVHGA